MYNEYTVRVVKIMVNTQHAHFLMHFVISVAPVIH